ncbi:GAF domain-containing protein [Agrobacterium tumefaciens]|uniref:GAF domain-containing protein n=1 Tax=Agrobacterium tumefaciens TaxID=358 RepID=UPI0015721251|nr:GAF domain-containing protein [Agrobacterium tumefaciens]NTA83766.1 GAF domain-containing protein [Agrobacterium tumefaciens]
MRDQNTLFRELDAEMQRDVGFILLTLLVVDGDEVFRVYSSHPESFPLGGRKSMGSTPWGELVIKNKQNFLARDKDRLRWAFYDHATTEGLGGGSQINIPVVKCDKCIGTINLTDREHVYTETHVRKAEKYAPRLVEAFAEIQRSTRPER